MAAVRRADATWSGDLPTGKGAVSGSSSGVFKQLDVSWPRRSEADANGVTSPEELLAAAHASCFAMALSAAPTSNETVTIASSGNTGLTASPTTLTFTPTNFATNILTIVVPPSPPESRLEAQAPRVTANSAAAVADSARVVGRCIAEDLPSRPLWAG